MQRGAPSKEPIPSKAQSDINRLAPTKAIKASPTE